MSSRTFDNQSKDFHPFRIPKEESFRITIVWLAILLSVFISCISAFAFSQIKTGNNSDEYPKHINLNGTSGVFFTLEQTQKLALINESFKECDTLLSMTNNSLNTCLNQSILYSEIIKNDSIIIKGKDDVISIKENQKEALITENKNLSSDLKKTKRKYKLTALSLLTTTVASLTLYLSTFI